MNGESELGRGYVHPNSDQLDGAARMSGHSPVQYMIENRRLGLSY